MECQKQADQQNIMLNKPTTISPTSNKEMRHVCSSSDGKSSTDELQSV